MLVTPFFSRVPRLPTGTRAHQAINRMEPIVGRDAVAPAAAAQHCLTAGPQKLSRRLAVHDSGGDRHPQSDEAVDFPGGPFFLDHVASRSLSCDRIERVLL